MSPLSKIIPGITLVVVTALAIFATTLRAQTVQPVKSMALRGVMDQLERDMQAVAGAISREDWARVAELSPKIADHPAPPLGEKLRILKWLGGDAGKFRGFDAQVHDAALAMGEAASHADGHAVIRQFAEVQQGCFACHQRFRARFRAHFHGGR